MKPSGAATIGGLLAFNGGLVDAAGFLGLHGLFTAHITGNLATLCAAIVLGSHGYLGKILALPEFVAVIALARFADARMRARKWPARDILLAAELVLLALFFALAMAFGPFANFDSAPALITALAAIAAMAVQNDMQRVHLPGVAPTTFMTGNATHATVGAVGILTGDEPAHSKLYRTMLRCTGINVLAFAAGCAVSALLYWAVGFWCLALPLVVALIATGLIRAIDPAPLESA
ncbi:MAG: YoaK family protein [Pseudolabrys sp.]